MSSKASILSVIRAQRVPEAPLPSLERAWLQFADPLAQFEAQVAGVGGRTVRVRGTEDIGRALAGYPEFTQAKQIVSSIEGIASTYQIDRVRDPHDLESVDWALLPADFGVAENGAVWVTDEGLEHRALYFIVQHLALVLPAREIVHNMHEAYARLNIGASSLGLFISGPSKTADIEQSLVIGAHGPRSLTVFLVESTAT